MSVSDNLYLHFQRQFLQRPDAVALTTVDGEQYSFGKLDDSSAQLAGFISSRGLLPGDRVSVQVDKSPQALILYLACLRGGFVYHPLNTGYQPAELKYFLTDAEPALLVCGGANIQQWELLAQELHLPLPLTLNGDGSGTLTELSRDCEPEPVLAIRTKDDMAALLYSSGTTGVPKGIVLSHGNLYSNAAALVELWGFTERDVLLHALPIYHVHGLFVALHCALLSGASMRWLAAFDAGAVVEQLPHCSVMMGVPTFYTRLLADPAFDRACVANMRLFISGSAPLLEDTFSAFEARTGQRILERYGMTETGMNSSNPLAGERRAGTVGPPLPGVELRIADEGSSPLAVGEIGRIQVRGDNVFQGYWKLPEKTAEDFTDDGFFDTGDQGRLDAQGYLSIVGRAKDLIISGGLNVYPKEVELAIDALPGVQESAVIGVPHADFGEAVVAVIVPSDGGELDAGALRSALKTQLAAFKLPKRLQFVDALPRNAMGKVRKNVLREKYRLLLKE